MSKELKNKRRRYPMKKVFIVTEHYAGFKNLSDILADLLYSVYKRKPNKSNDQSGKSSYKENAS